MLVDVAVVVVTYNSADVIGPLLDSIPAALSGLSYAVVVVDNGSRDETPRIVQSRDDVHFVASHNAGYSAGINAGVAAGPESRTVLILNPDVRLGDSSVSEMFSCMRETNAGVVAPRVLDPDGSLSLSLRRTPTLLRVSGLSFTGWPSLSEHVQDLDLYTQRHDVDWAVGAVLLVSTPCHQALGGWDESYFLYSEETDFCLRAADRGWATIFEPKASAEHVGGGSGRSAQTAGMQAINRVRLYARRHGRAASWAYFLLVILGEVRALALGREFAGSTLMVLLSPRRRPEVLACGGGYIPR